MTPPPHSFEFPPDPWAPFRREGHLVIDFGLGRFPLFVGYDDVKEAARDWRAFTSDTPFEVPIPPEHDVRAVRQLPIETDPPDHTAYRDLIAHRFTRAAVDAHATLITAVVDEILAVGIDGEPLDVVTGLAIPVVNHGLAAALGRPESEAAQWMAWGVHVFDTQSGARGPNPDLDRYLAAAIDHAIAHGGEDFFGQLAGATLRGRPLTRDEVHGFANLVFAGGRDTVIGTIAATFAYLASHADSWARLRDDVSLVPRTIEEILRLSSPLPFIGRHATAACTHAGAEIEPGDLVALGFAAANRDPDAFADADRCLLDRHPNRHIAFGHGPHTCIGANLARMELRVTLRQVLRRAARIELAEPVETKDLHLGGQVIPYAFETVSVRLHSG